MPQNRVKVDIDVESNARERLKEFSESLVRAERALQKAGASAGSMSGEIAKAGQAAQLGQENLGDYATVLQKANQGAQAFLVPNGRFVRGILTAADAIRSTNREGEKFPSVMMRAALAAQELKVGYVEGLGDMAEETQAFAEVLSRAQWYVEDVAFSMGKVWEGVNKQFDLIFTDQAKLSFEAGQKAFTDLQKSIDDGLTNVFAASFSKSTDNVKKSWEKFLESLEATFYQSLGRMASALVQENLLAPLFKLGQEAVGGLLSAGKSLLGLAQGGLVTKPTLALIGEAGPEVVLPLAA